MVQYSAGKALCEEPSLTNLVSYTCSGDSSTSQELDRCRCGWTAGRNGIRFHLHHTGSHGSGSTSGYCSLQSKSCLPMII